MATKKKTGAAKAAASDKNERRPTRNAESYEIALAEYEAAIKQLHAREFQPALEGLEKVLELVRDEPELAERARTWATVCRRKLAPPEKPPATVEERYNRAVVLINQGRLDEGIALLDEAAREEPTNVSVLYARASARALQGKTDAVVTDLRQAILVDSTVRYQAVNDPDFEKVRDDAAFIDLIEPTTSGA